jgi:ribose transport system substrate-binding protein
MNRRTRALAWSILPIAAVAATACAPPAPSTGAGAQSSLHKPLACDRSFTPDELLSYRVPKADKRYKVTLMEVSLAGYYYQGIDYGAQQAAAQAGIDLTVVAGNGYTTPGPQLSQADDVLQRGTDAIILQPVDTEGSVPIVTSAKAKGVPVVDFSTEVDSKDVAAAVLQDDYELGRSGADQLAKAVPGGGNGILIAGPATATWSKKRVAGFEDELKKYPKFSVVAAPTQPVDPAAGLKDFTDAVQAHPKIDWIYSVFYYQLLPDSLPGKYKGLPFVTTGYEPAAIRSLQNGTLTVTSSVENVWMGYVAVAAAVNVLNKADAPKLVCLPTPSFTRNDIGGKVADSELFPATFKASS